MYGIDILEEIVYFLDIILEKKIFIVLIGVMWLSNEIGSDGLYNFISVIWIVCLDELYDKGVLVVMNDEIYMVCYVIKIYIMNVVMFWMLIFGLIGIIVKECVFFVKEVLL